MKGDYHRYLAEFKTGADRKEAAEHTLLAYKAAQVREGREGASTAGLFPSWAGSSFRVAPDDLAATRAPSRSAGHCPGGPGAHAPHPPGPGAQLLGLLL